jgi:hypothetical protein
MRAAIFIPDCCGRARVAADAARLPVGVRAELDKYLCGEVRPMDAVKEVAQLCRKVDGRRSMFGWTLVVSDCRWEEVEDVVVKVGGDMVYMPR